MSGDLSAHGTARLSALSTAQRRRLFAQALLRPTLTAALLVAGYFLLPLENTHRDRAWLYLTGGVILVAVVLAWQLRQILHADYPMLQAIETLATVVPIYLLAFSATYVLLSGSNPGSFSERLTHMAALYFSVVVFSTVGFGDITPQTDSVRAVVTLQIIGNLLIIGIGVRLLLSAVKRGQERQVGSEDP